MACLGLLFAIFVKGYIFQLDKINSVTVVFAVGEQYFPIKLKFTESSNWTVHLKMYKFGYTFQILNYFCWVYS